MGKELKQPIILSEGIAHQKDLDDLKKSYPVWNLYDLYKDQLKELFEVKNPSLKNSPDYQEKINKFTEEKSLDSETIKGDWIYYPWNGNLIHTINKEDLFLLRTNRNRNLITLEEQEGLREFTVGMAGLSVGSNIALALAYQGIGNSMKLADFDTLDTTNLNRVRAGLHQIGLPKIEIATRQIYEINPYANLKTYPEGLKKENLQDFVNSEPKPKLIFEIIDDFEMKVLLREEAKKAGVPVITMANVGDSVVIDIERYDLDPNLAFFNGLLGTLPEEFLKNPKGNPHEYAIKTVVIENVPKRALDSVNEIDKTLMGRPQLSSTVIISSGLASYLTRKIALGKNLPSGRKIFSLPDILNLEDDLNI